MRGCSWGPAPDNMRNHEQAEKVSPHQIICAANQTWSEYLSLRRASGSLDFIAYLLISQLYLSISLGSPLPHCSCSRVYLDTSTPLQPPLKISVRKRPSSPYLSPTRNQSQTESYDHNSYEDTFLVSGIDILQLFTPNRMKEWHKAPLAVTPSRWIGSENIRFRQLELLQTDGNGWPDTSINAQNGSV